MSNNVTDLFKFFIFFYVVSFMLLITYSLSFYISDLVRIFKDPFKIVYILIYSISLGFYFSAYVVYNVKRAKVILFTSCILTLFYLHEYQRNIFISRLGYEYSHILWYVYLGSGGVSLVLSITALVIQLRACGHEFNYKPINRKHKHRDGEYFI